MAGTIYRKKTKTTMSTTTTKGVIYIGKKMDDEHEKMIMIMLDDGVAPNDWTDISLFSSKHDNFKDVNTKIKKLLSKRSKVTQFQPINLESRNFNEKFRNEKID